MPTRNYKSVTLRLQLVERVEQTVQKAETYRSVAEFISEAVRLRLEAIEKRQKKPEEKKKDKEPTS
jgi:Arc/MetJ-type ribon-helix-helix transcriptional regulator